MSSDPTDPLPGARGHGDGGPGLVTAFTLVVWVACVAIGVTGLMSQPATPPPAPASQPVTQVVNVELEATPAPPQPVATPVAPAAPVPQAVTPAVPSIPTAAVPSPAIAFAVPVAGPARIGTAAEAVPVRSVGVTSSHHLTGGSSDGDHLPQPVYPDDAARAGQTGVVHVGFTVDHDGRVTRAWLITPCQWPLLNQEALRAARDTPQPAGGAARDDDYSPDFH